MYSPICPMATPADWATPANAPRSWVALPTMLASTLLEPPTERVSWSAAAAGRPQVGVEILDLRRVDRVERRAKLLRLGFDGVELDTRLTQTEHHVGDVGVVDLGANFLTWPTALPTFSASSPACFRLVMNLSILPVSGRDLEALLDGLAGPLGFLADLLELGDRVLGVDVDLVGDLLAGHQTSIASS